MDIVCVVGWVSFFMLHRLLWWRLLVGRSSSLLLLPWSVCSTSSIQLLSLWNCTQMDDQPALVDDCGDALGKSVTQSILFAVFVFVGCARQNNCQGWQRYKLRLLMSAGYSIPEEVYSGCLRSWFLNWFVEFLWRTLGFIESKTKEEWNLKTWRLNSWIITKAVDEQCCVVSRKMRLAL